jgi:hypothetical protein
MSIACSFFGGSSGNPACATWWITTSIDNFSRKIWVYFLKYKYDVLQIFKQFKAMVENESDQRNKIFKSNIGGAYESHALLW